MPAEASWIQGDEAIQHGIQKVSLMEVGFEIALPAVMGALARNGSSIFQNENLWFPVTKDLDLAWLDI